MTSEQFAYWLQGFMELNYTDSPTVDQWKCIKAHLATVFDKKAPSTTLTVNGPPVNEIPIKWGHAIYSYDIRRAIEEYENEKNNKV